MTSAATISVITITLNDLDGLKRTVASVQAQRYAGRIEHIVIDGGSGADVVEKRPGCDPGFAYWQSRPDGGRYDAMNQGIAQASGDLLWFLHSADCFADADAADAVVAVGPTTSWSRRHVLWGYGIEHEVWPGGGIRSARLSGAYTVQHEEVPDPAWRPFRTKRLFSAPRS